MEKKIWFISEIYFILNVVFISNNWTLCAGSKISDLRLCADDDCKTVLSLAKTLARHQNNDPIFLTFSRGEIVQVLSKSAGNRPDLWGGQIGDRKGYFPRSFVREYKVEIPNPGRVVSTQGKDPGQPSPGPPGGDDTELGDDTDITEETDASQGVKSAEEIKQSDAEHIDIPTKDASEDQQRKEEQPEDKVVEEQTDEKQKVDETEVADETELPDEDDGVSVMSEEQELESNDEKKSSEGKTQSEEKNMETKDSDKTVEANDSGKTEETKDSGNTMETTDSGKNVEEGTQEDHVHIIESEDGLQISDTTQPSTDNIKEAGDELNQEQIRLKEGTDENNNNIQDPTEVGSEEKNAENKDDQQIRTESGEASKELQDLEESDDKQRNDGNKEKQEDLTELDNGEKKGENVGKQQELKESLDENKNGDIMDKPQDQLQTEEKPQDSTELDNGEKKGENTEIQLDNGEKKGENTEIQLESATKQVDKDIESNTKKINPEDNQLNKEVISSTQDLGKITDDSIKPTPALVSTDQPSEVKPSSELSMESIQATPSFESNDRFTIIDGTPFPLDMFDDSVKTVGSTKTSFSEIQATSSQEIVSPSTPSENVQIVHADSVVSDQQKNIQDQNIQAEAQPVEIVTQTVETVPQTVETVTQKDDNNQDNVGSNQQTDGDKNVLNNEPQKLSDSLTNDKKPEQHGITGEGVNQPTTTFSGHPDVEDVTEQYLKDQMEKSSGIQDSDKEHHEKPVNDKTEQAFNDDGTQRSQENLNGDGTQRSQESLNDNANGSTEQQTISQDENLNVVDVQTGSTVGDGKQQSGSTIGDGQQQSGSTIDGQKSGSSVGEGQHTGSTVDDKQQTSSTVTDGQQPASSTVDNKGEQTMQYHSGSKTTLEDLQGSAAEQLVSSMGIPNQPSINQATMMVNDHSHMQFGVANDTGHTSRTTEPQVHDIYTTADFVSRKPLSHNSGVPADPPDTRQTVTPHSLPEEIPPPPVGDATTPSPAAQEETVLSRRITDDNLEEMENKEFRDQYGLDYYLKAVVEKLPPSIQSVLEQEPLGMTPHMTVLVTIVTLVMATLISCVTFALGGKQKSRKSDPLVVVRGLEEKLFIATKERENLEDELELSQKKIQQLEEDVKVQTSSSGTIATEVGTYKALIKDHEKTVSSQQNEIDKLSNELQQKKKDLQSKTSKLEETQKQLKKKEQAFENLSEKLKTANKDLDDGKAELKSEKNQNIDLTKQIEQLEVSKQQLLQEAEGWSEKVQDITERYEALQQGQAQIQENLALKDNEIEVLRDCFLQLKAFEDTESDDDGKSIEDKLKSMMDVSGVNAQLKMVEEERNLLQNRVDIEVQSRMDMEEQIAEYESKLEALKTDKMKAERQSHDATTKLNVLSNYFKEKEAQLQKELGEQEALKKQNINKLESADEVTKMVQEELENYRLQTEDLKKEILSAERDFRSQIAANEKKAHDNWLSARAAERELKESRHECSVLRQKLTDLERRLMHGPSGLIRPLPTRGMPPPGMLNGPPDRPGSRSGPFPPPGMRDDDMRGSPVRLPPPDRRSRMPPPDPRSPPPMDRHGGPRMPPLDPRSPPPLSRGPPPPMDGRGPPIDRRSPPPFDRHRGPPGYRMPPPPDMLPPHLRGPPPLHASPPPVSHIREPPPQNSRSRSRQHSKTVKSSLI